jgi:hypothetical protein
MRAWAPGFRGLVFDRVYSHQSGLFGKVRGRTYPAASQTSVCSRHNRSRMVCVKLRFVLRMFPVNEQGVFQFGFSCAANLNSIMRMRLCPPLKILASSPYPVVYE